MLLKEFGLLQFTIVKFRQEPPLFLKPSKFNCTMVWFGKFVVTTFNLTV